MAGEESVLEVAFDNAALSNFTPNTVAQLDTAHSNAFTTAAQTPAATASLPVVGVIYDRARTDNTGAVVSQAMNVRVMGIARVIASAAIAVGQYVGTSGTAAGQVVGVTPGTVATKVPVLGLALNQAVNAGDQVLVLLTPGVMV